MGETKDYLDNPVPSTQTNKLIDKIVAGFPTLNYMGLAVPMNTNAQAVAARGTSFAIEPAAYAAQFISRMHTDGLNCIFRGTDSAFEGIYSFPKLSLNNGNRFDFFGDPIIDNFSSTVARVLGYNITVPAGQLPASVYLTNHQTGNDWSISGNELIGPPANGWKRTILFNGNYIKDVTMVAKVKKVGNQMIVVRAATDANFPGYGLQMRDSGTLRIERPGLANLGEVTTKAWVEGNYYWLKLTAQGTSIKAKSWADGNTEPTTGGGSGNNNGWDIEITDSTYATGYCGFGGESDNGHFDAMTITPTVDTTSWMYRACGFIRTNISMFNNGDMVVPFPEASSHQTLTNNGTYNQFFADLKFCVEKIGSDNGKVLLGGFNSHIWTSAIQGSYNDLFAAQGMATYDHYGTSIGLNERFGSFQNGVNTGSSVYSLLSSLSEAAANKCLFYPEKIAYNTDIDVFIVDKGTGDWIMEIHAADNSRVQMCDEDNFASKTTTGIVTKLNASLTPNAFNTFSIDWDNPRPDVQYHFHLYSTNGTGTARVTSGSTSLQDVVANGYKPLALAKGIKIDIRKTFDVTGVPQYLQEWGDYWSLDATRSDPVRTQIQHIAYLADMFAGFQTLIDANILEGFNYWRATGGFESFMTWNGSDYDFLYNAAPIQDFFNDNSGETAPTGPFPTFLPNF